MNSIPARRPYQGLVQILQFNWRSYFGAAMGVGVAILALPFLHPISRVALLLAAVPATFWLASSLIVSHYIYDRFPLYDLKWISRILPRAPRRWINIHCGFDETSGLLAAIFPEAVIQVVDIYDPQVMTEASIRLGPAAQTQPNPVRRGALRCSGIQLWFVRRGILDLRRARVAPPRSTCEFV